MAAGLPGTTRDTNTPLLWAETLSPTWRKKRESTATSPFGLHVGHFKVGLDEEDIAEVHREMMIIPFQIGYAPKRWRKTVQLMLEKDKGRSWIHRLRIIELFDAQLNAALQIIVGKRMVYNALQKGCIGNNAYGSVPGRTPHGAILHKLLTVDQLRQEKRAGALFECDATGCYDRILPKFLPLHTR